MKDIEIPLESERHFRYRLFEALPGILSWTLLFLPIILSVINVTLAAVFILGYLLINFTRAIAGAARAMQGFRIMREHQSLDWQAMLDEIERGQADLSKNRPRWHYDAVDRLQKHPLSIAPSEIVHAIIIATYKESREVLIPTIESVIASHYNMKQVILILAYEERGGERVEALANELMEKYGHTFLYAKAIKHPSDIPGEIIGKGGNVTYAGKQLKKDIKEWAIDPKRVVVTTLDADNHPDKKYLGALSYVYALCPDPEHSSFQPVAMYTNNIWDAPAPMRVVATGNSFFNVVLSLRPHAIRNFSTHAQSMTGLIKTNFWSVRTVVEDGHQYWRSYFCFNGNYRVYPLYLPIYQDAVLSDKYSRTLKAQFIQLRRWAWGASDVAYVANEGFFKRNKISKLDLSAKFFRLLEGHVTWATGPMLTLLAGFIPAFIHPQSFAANELPLIVKRIQTVTLLGGVTLVFFALKTLPPKPERYRRHRSLFMVLQWIYLPITTIAYNSMAALNSQTRLIFGWYLGKFDVTEKTVVTEDKRKVT